MDAFTGVVPNKTWGSGKLNITAALAPLASVQIPYPPSGANLPPAKWDSVQVSMTGATADSVELHLSLDGGGAYPTMIGKLYHVVPGPPHTVLFQPQSGWSTAQAKIRGRAYFTSGTLDGFSETFTISLPTAVEPVVTTTRRGSSWDGTRPIPSIPRPRSRSRSTIRAA